MRAIAILFTIALLAAGCRAGFPSLNDAPSGAPDRLVEARERAAAEQARLAAAARPGPAATPAPAPGARPAKLLAALPLGPRPPRGVLDRAALEARTSGRAVQVVGVGPGGLEAARSVAALLRERGLSPHVGAAPTPAGGPGRVELYLLP